MQRWAVRLVPWVIALLLLSGCSAVPQGGLSLPTAAPSGPNANNGTRATNASPPADTSGVGPAKSPSNPPGSSATTELTSPHTANPLADLPVLSVGRQGPAVLRLQQLLARLGYLPVEWHPVGTDEPAASSLHAIDYPPSGQWKWISGPAPTSLTQLWQPAHYNVLVQGAVMAFQHSNHLQMDGVAGPQVWGVLLGTTGLPTPNPTGYGYVEVDLSQPQTVTVWWNGRRVLRSLANAGIRQSPTVTGTYPVYLRFTSQRMSGTAPGGTHYDDPHVPWVSYFYKGEAIHGFPRKAYGFPQSLGCVELPVHQGAIAWKYMSYGTLVTVLPAR